MIREHEFTKTPLPEKIAIGERILKKSTDTVTHHGGDRRKNHAEAEKVTLHVFHLRAHSVEILTIPVLFCGYAQDMEQTNNGWKFGAIIGALCLPSLTLAFFTGAEASVFGRASNLDPCGYGPFLLIIAGGMLGIV